LAGILFAVFLFDVCICHVAEARVGTLLATAMRLDPHLRSRRAVHLWMHHVLRLPWFACAWRRALDSRRLL
jgi:hypothetical protein